MNPIGSSSIPSITPGIGGSQTGQAAGGFSDTLKQVFQQAEADAESAQQKVNSVVTGQGEDLNSAVLAVEKAGLSFELMMQVRNKILQAYQEVSHMQF
jgi:flagellar hook-basal body complex protein FliE